MQFSIITPSFRNSEWLKLCIASVADQGIAHEHIVQDSCSDDGTQEWLPHDTRVQAFIEKDRGMYDAVNRGLRRAKGDLLAYINCDEQYLPGALERVARFFAEHPDVDVVFANTVVVDQKGDYLCHRQPLIPYKPHVWVCGNLPVLTCATFFRRRLIDQQQLFFDPNLKDIADATWIMRLLGVRIKMALLPEFTSVFTETGANMNLLPNAQREKRGLYDSAPAYIRATKTLLLLQHRLRRFLAGHYRVKPFAFELYTEASPHRRVVRRVERPTYRWIRPAPAPV